MNRIVVIEDSRTQAQHLARVLTDEGFEVVVCRDGEAGLRAVHESAPDVVVSDIVMPGIDGFEVCRRLKSDEGTKDVPVMLLTSLADTTDVLRGLAAGADNFLTKPYDDAHLVERVRRLSNRAADDVTASVTLRGESFEVRSRPAQVLDVLVSALEAVTLRNVEIELNRQLAETALEQARRAVKLRDDVIAVVSHDLRNPLNTISLAAQMAESHPDDIDDLRHKLKLIKRSAERMNLMVTTLLDSAQLDAGHMTLDCATVSTSQLLDEVLQTHKSLADARSISLRVEAGGEPATLALDRERIIRVFSNLIGNALKFTRIGGAITLRSDRRGERVYFAVSDTGQGIAAEDLPKVFDRFWQAQRGKTQGAGLGLAIIKGIIEAHRGEVGVESVEGEGTTFWFTLPIGDAAE